MRLSRIAVAASLAFAASAFAQDKDMSFFVTSAGSGKGADLGGVKGADQHCQALAKAAGAGNKTWRAYLSTNALATPPVAARERIGNGPWKNAKGVTIATSIADLHSANNKLSKETALSEKGEPTKGAGDTPNQHDILTGSTPDGRALPADKGDTTCGNWTKSGEGAAMVGHHDRTGLDESAPAKSWNSSHQSRGCSLDALKATGGDARIYCFAAN